MVMLLDIVDVVFIVWLAVGMNILLVGGTSVVLVVGMGVVLVVGIDIVLVFGIGVVLIVQQVGHVHLKANHCLKVINNFEGEFLLLHYIIFLSTDKDIYSGL